MSPKHSSSEPELPEGIFALILGSVNRRYRPTLMALVSFGAVIVGSLWLDARAKAYIDAAAEARIATLTSRVDTQEKQLSEQDGRMRVVEQNIAAIQADVHSLREDTHDIRQQLDRHR